MQTNSPEATQDSPEKQMQNSGRWKLLAVVAAIADGNALLACPWGGVPGTLVAGTAPGESEVQFGFSPRSSSDNDLRGYA